MHSFRLEQTNNALTNYKDSMHREESMRQTIQHNIEQLSIR